MGSSQSSKKELPVKAQNNEQHITWHLLSTCMPAKMKITPALFSKIQETDLSDLWMQVPENIRLIERNTHSFPMFKQAIDILYKNGLAIAVKTVEMTHKWDKMYFTNDSNLDLTRDCRKYDYIVFIMDDASFAALNARIAEEKVEINKRLSTLLAPSIERPPNYTIEPPVKKDVASAPPYEETVMSNLTDQPDQLNLSDLPSVPADPPKSKITEQPAILLA